MFHFKASSDMSVPPFNDKIMNANAIPFRLEQSTWTTNVPVLYLLLIISSHELTKRHNVRSKAAYKETDERSNKAHDDDDDES